MREKEKRLKDFIKKEKKNRSEDSVFLRRKTLKKILSDHASFLYKNGYRLNRFEVSDLLFDPPTNLSEFFNKYVLLELVNKTLINDDDYVNELCQEDDCKKKLPRLIFEMKKVYDGALRLFEDSLFDPITLSSYVFKIFYDNMALVFKKYVLQQSYQELLDKLDGKWLFIKERMDEVKRTYPNARLYPFDNMVLYITSIINKDKAKVKSFVWFIDEDDLQLIEDEDAETLGMYYDEYYNIFDFYDVNTGRHLYFITYKTLGSEENEFYGLKRLTSLYYSDKIAGIYNALRQVYEDNGVPARDSVILFLDEAVHRDIVENLADLLNYTFVKNAFVITDKNGKIIGKVVDYDLDYSIITPEVTFKLTLSNGKEISLTFDSYDIIDELFDILFDYSDAGYGDNRISIAHTVIRGLNDKEKEKIFLRLAGGFNEKILPGYDCRLFTTEPKEYYICLKKDDEK